MLLVFLGLFVMKYRQPTIKKEDQPIWPIIRPAKKSNRVAATENLNNNLASFIPLSFSLEKCHYINMLREERGCVKSHLSVAQIQIWRKLAILSRTAFNKINKLSSYYNAI